MGKVNSMTNPSAMPQKVNARVITVKRWDRDWNVIRQTKLQPMAKPNRAMADAVRAYAAQVVG